MYKRQAIVAESSYSSGYRAFPDYMHSHFPWVPDWWIDAYVFFQDLINPMQMETGVSVRVCVCGCALLGVWMCVPRACVRACVLFPPGIYMQGGRARGSNPQVCASAGVCAVGWASLSCGRVRPHA